MSLLNDLTTQQIKEFYEYLQFEIQKRREIRGEISGELDSLIHSIIDPKQFYSGPDDMNLQNELSQTISKTLNIELERQRDISVVLYRNIFLQAQEHQIAIEFSIPELKEGTVTDAANEICTRVLNGGEALMNNHQTIQVSNEPTYDELLEENNRLKAQLQANKRDWKEFVDAQQKLKQLNNELHVLRQ